MKNLSLKIFSVLMILLFTKQSNAQNYNINILPARLVYFKNIGLEPYFVYKYAEIEKRLSDKFSASVGVYYSNDKEEQALGSYKYYYYNIEPSLRYYFNKEHNMSGFYVGSGFSYLHSNLK